MTLVYYFAFIDFIRHSVLPLIQCGYSVADLEGVRVVRLNPPLGPNYFNFMGKFMNLGKMLKTNPLLINLNPPSRNPGSAPGY